MRLAGVTALAAAIGLFGCDAETEDTESSSESVIEGDSLEKPTEHGAAAFGERVTARIAGKHRHHAWTFELAGDAVVSLRTSEEAGDEPDTVLYLYEETDGRWGEHIARNDDESDESWYSRLDEPLAAGRYRVVVEGLARRDTGAFGLDITCAGAGCTTAHPLDEIPGGVCEGVLTADDAARLLDDPTSLRESGAAARTTFSYEDGVLLGHYDETFFERTCSSKKGGCEVWGPGVPDRLLAQRDRGTGSGTLFLVDKSGAIHLGLKSEQVGGSEPPEAIGWTEGWSTNDVVAAGARGDTLEVDIWAARAGWGEPSETWDRNFRRYFHATATGSCTKIWFVLEEREWLGGGAWTELQRAMVIDVRY